ncbi:hypothetical protein Tco_0668446 [Tanacetum coccineum]
MGGQLNAARVLEVENFTNWKKRFMFHIVGIEPQFKNIILIGPYVLMTADFQDSPYDEEDTRSSQEYMNDLEMEFHERALLAKSKRFFKKGLVAKAYKWDEKEVSSDDNEMVEVKVLMALADDESGAVGKESVRNGKWVKISIRNEQRNNLVIKHRDIIQELNASKEKLLELKQAKLDFLTMQHCISEQIPNQKRKILGVDQLTEDPSSSEQKDLVFVKNLVDDTKVSIPNVERPWLSKTKRFNFPNHDTVVDYDSAEESSLICKTPLPPLEKLAGAERVSGPKTIKSILKSCSTIKTDTLKGVIINEPTNSSALAKGNKNVSISKKGSASASKLKNVKTEDDIPLSIVMKELNDQKLQISKNQSAYSKNNKPQHFILQLITMISSGSEEVKHFKLRKSDIKKPIWFSMELLDLLAKSDEKLNVVSTIQTKSPLSIPSMASPTPYDKWSRDKHIELVKIVGNPRAGMLTRAMAKELSAALAYECLFVDFLFEEEPKKIFEALKHTG